MPESAEGSGPTSGRQESRLRADLRRLRIWASGIPLRRGWLWPLRRLRPLLPAWWRRALAGWHERAHRRAWRDMLWIDDASWVHPSLARAKAKLAGAALHHQESAIYWTRGTVMPRQDSLDPEARRAAARMHRFFERWRAGDPAAVALVGEPYRGPHDR